MFFDFVSQSEVQKRWDVPGADANLAAWTPQKSAHRSCTRYLKNTKKYQKMALDWIRPKKIRSKAQLFEDSASFAITSIELYRAKTSRTLYELRCHWLLLSVYSIHACFYGPQHLQGCNESLVSPHPVAFPDLCFEVFSSLVTPAIATFQPVTRSDWWYLGVALTHQESHNKAWQKPPGALVSEWRPHTREGSGSPCNTLNALRHIESLWIRHHDSKKTNVSWHSMHSGRPRTARTLRVPVVPRPHLQRFATWRRWFAIRLFKSVWRRGSKCEATVKCYLRTQQDWWAMCWCLSSLVGFWCAWTCPIGHWHSKCLA